MNPESDLPERDDCPLPKSEESLARRAAQHPDICRCINCSTVGIERARQSGFRTWPEDPCPTPAGMDAAPEPSFSTKPQLADSDALPKPQLATCKWCGEFPKDHACTCRPTHKLRNCPVHGVLAEDARCAAKRGRDDAVPTVTGGNDDALRTHDGWDLVKEYRAEIAGLDLALNTEWELHEVTMTELEKLRAEVERMRPVVEAAIKAVAQGSTWDDEQALAVATNEYEEATK